MSDRHWTAEEIEQFADGEASPDERHLRECARCGTAVLSAMQLKRAVREAMAVGPAPASLRSSRRSPWLWLAAVAAVAAIIYVPAALMRFRSQTALAELADLHVTMLASANPVDVLSTDRHTVKPWFEGRVPFAVPVPDLSSTPFRLVGGRVVYWRGNQAAYLLIAKNAHRISLFVFRDQDAPPTSGPAPRTMTTLSWKRDGLTFVAVADVPKEDLAQLRDAFTPSNGR